MSCSAPARRLLAAPLATLLAFGVAPSVRAQPAVPADDSVQPGGAPVPGADPKTAAPPTETVETEGPAGEGDPETPADAEPTDQDAAGDLDARSDAPGNEAQEGEDASGDEDEDEDDGAPASPETLNLPDRLEPLPRAAWWSLFGAFTLGTTAGVLAGLAERQEDKALRLTLQLDTEDGQAPLYADERDTYEQILRRGERLQTGAIVMGAFAGAAAIAGITLFVLDAKRGRPSQTARRTQLRSNGIEVRF